MAARSRRRTPGSMGSPATARGAFASSSSCVEGANRPDRQLVAYASDTGWTGETRVEFDARSLVHAFGQVLAFSRGLLLDEGGHVGVERTFAGARVVRALAIRDRGDGDIEIERVSRDGEGSPVAGGATFSIERACVELSRRLVASDGRPVRDPRERGRASMSSRSPSTGGSWSRQWSRRVEPTAARRARCRLCPGPRRWQCAPGSLLAPGRASWAMRERRSRRSARSILG
jgi:hypothetical protein